VGARLEFAAGSNMARLSSVAALGAGIVTADYESLWRWSVSEPAAFWTAIWDILDILHDGHVRKRDEQPGDAGCEMVRGSTGELCGTPVAA